MNQKSFNIIAVVFTLLLAAAFVAELLVLNDGNLTIVDFLVFIAQDIVSILAVFYLLAGCKKGEGSKYYKWYMIAFAFHIFISMLQAPDMAIANIMLLTLSFGALCVLCFGKDLGKSFSMILAWIVVGCAVAHFILSLVVAESALVVLLKVATMLVFALITLLLVSAKYADKSSRGSK